MSATNLGEQVINHYDFKHPAKGGEFNRLLRGIVKPGVYNGGFAAPSGNAIIVQPLRVFMYMGDDSIAHVQTTNTATVIPVAPDDEILYITYEYKEEEENWLDWGFRKESDAPVPNEIIICKITFAGSNVGSVDNSVKTLGFFDEEFNALIEGKLVVTDDPTTQDGVGNLQFNDSRYMSYDYYSQKLEDFQNRIQNAEEKLLHNSLDISYLMQRKSNFSDWLLETYFDREHTSENHTALSRPADILDNKSVGWACNWKSRENTNDNLDFKNGFIRPKKLNAIGDIIGFYDTANVGAYNKQALSRYDSVNDCYWFMTVNTSNTGPNWISKIRIDDLTNKIEVLSQWALAKPINTNCFYSGIDVTLDGQFLLLTITNSGIAYSEVALGKLSINEDNTLGRNNTSTGRSIYWDETWTGTSDFTAIDQLDRVANGNYYPDLTVWDDTHVALVKVEKVGSTGYNVFSLEFHEIADNGIGGFTTGNPRSNIEGFEEFCKISQDSLTTEISLCVIKQGNELWMKSDDQNDNLRHIQKYIINEDSYTGTITPDTEEYHGDVVGYLASTGDLPKVIRSSMRLDAISQVATSVNGSIPRSGISISKDGHLLESVNDEQGSRVLYKRALQSAKWAENHINRDVPIRRYVGADIANMGDTYGCMVEDNRYYWTTETARPANEVDVWRFDTVTGTYKHARLTGRSWTSCYDLTYNPTTREMYLIGRTSTTSEVYFGDIDSFVSQMGDSFHVTNNNIDLTVWGTATAITGLTEVFYCICYDAEDNLVYILQNNTDKIDSLSLDGTVYTPGVFALPAPTDSYRGLASKNNLLYISDFTNAVTPHRILTIDKNLTNDTDYYKVHIYQDPSLRMEGNGTLGIDFDGNDLVVYHTDGKKFHRLKTLEDPTVMQLHTFMDVNNILMENNVRGYSDIQQRYHSPEEFKEYLPVDSGGNYDPSSTDYAYLPSKRNVPDRNYIVLNYFNAGISVLNLDEYLSDRSSAGMERYDVRKIRTIDFESGGTTVNDSNLITDVSTWTGYAITVEKDMIFVGSEGVGVPFYMINLTTGLVHYLYTDQNRTYLGTISEKNDGKGYTDPSNNEHENDELYLSDNDCYYSTAKTFSKEDDSDYNYENPRTYVYVSHPSTGHDLLVIEWDANGNKTLVKVWNNIATNSGYGRYSAWIASSGELFVGDYAYNGSLFKLTEKVWEISEDNNPKGFITVATTSEFGGGYPMMMSERSVCYKLPTGEWRHMLVFGTYEDSGGNGVTNLNVYDVENKINYNLISDDSSYFGWHFSDNYEDRIYSAYADTTGTNDLRGIGIFKYSHFTTNESILNDVYTPTYDIASKWHMNMIQGASYPRFLRAQGDDGIAYFAWCKYHNQHGILSLPSKNHGVQFWHDYYEDQCQHESIEIDTENPNYYYYIQNAILGKSVRTIEE